MPRIRRATVLSVDIVHPDGTAEITVDVYGETGRAYVFPRWCAVPTVGDKVAVNTTAVDLGLGTGGWHFMVASLDVPNHDAVSGGHLMKLRYTPLQTDVLSAEAPESVHHEKIAAITNLDGLGVVVAGLHSQVVPVVAAARAVAPDARIAYVMTDGASLEAGLSVTVRELRKQNWIQGVITTGHAIGGDLETVTVPSALAAAKAVLDADIAVVAMGPGVVGSDTRWGTTALEVAANANYVTAIGGRAIVAVRASEGDQRERHQGVSHHTQTALEMIQPARDGQHLPVAVVPVGASARPEFQSIVEAEVPPSCLQDAADAGFPLSHMGRQLNEDRMFFEYAAAAGAHAAAITSTR